MVPATGRTICLDEELEGPVGTPVLPEEVAERKAEVQKAIGMLPSGVDDPLKERLTTLEKIEELARDSKNGGLVRVGPEAVQRCRLGDRELERRARRKQSPPGPPDPPKPSHHRPVG